MKDYSELANWLMREGASCQKHIDCANAIKELTIAAKRYETVRRMTPAQFTELFRVNVHQGINFDDLVDNAGEGK